jgi:hypothetical protein
MILNDIRLSDTQLPETDHTPYCPGRDIDRGFIIEQSKDLQVASHARARGKGRKGSRDHADGACARASNHGARQYEVLLLQHLQKPLAASSAAPWLRC